jgi:chromosome segregation ATPase
MNDGGPIAPTTINDPPGEASRPATPRNAMAHARLSESGNDHADQSALVEHAVLESRIAELELRLRERVEENVVLDNEVRCLQKERVINQEYAASLLQDAARLPEVERDLRGTKHQLENVQAELEMWRLELQRARVELEEARTELEAFRNRLSGVLVDRTVVSVKRFPGLYRVVRYMARTTVRSFRN